jgi:hypothetical protein
MAIANYLLDRRIIPVAVAGILILGGQNALACGKGKLLFQDKFQTIDPRWHLSADPTRSLDAGVLSYTFPPNLGITVLNYAGVYDDYEVCAQITMKQNETSNSSAGLIFWGVDALNNYIFRFTARDGSYAVYRTQKGKNLAQIPWGEPSAAIKKGSGVTNELSVAVRGDHAVVSVNNQKLAEFDGQPPDGGSQIGFTMGTPKDDQGQTVFGISELEVRALQ